MEAVIEQLRTLGERAIDIWLQGGWAMIALAVNSFILFVVGLNIWFGLRASGFKSMPEKKWRPWITDESKRKGAIGRLIRYVMDADNLKDMTVRFSELRSSEIAPFVRELRFMKRAVGTAPLLGLLGTVTGMLTTFKGLAGGSGGDQTMEQIAAGISEALVTTETGLVIALVGVFFQYRLQRQAEAYDAFLQHLECACAQHVYKRDQEAMPKGA